MTYLRQRRALAADADPAYRAVMSSVLRSTGFEVVDAVSGADAVAAARSIDPAIVVLAASMPDVDGVEACRRIRTFCDAHIVMLAAHDDEADLLLELGVGDGYLTKPFSARELAARVRTVSHRPAPGDAPHPNRSAAGGRQVVHEVGTVRRFGRLTVDPPSRSASIDGVRIALTRTEFDLLDALTANPQVTLRREALVERVWGKNYVGDAHMVDVHMANLRRKLGDDARRPRYFRTCRGVGYRMVGL